MTPRPITVTADALARACGAANPVLTFAVGGSGLANGDALSGALASPAVAGSNVGVSGIVQGTLTAAANPNHALAFTGANLTVGTRAVTITADARIRLLGAANLTFAVVGGGLINGDGLTGALSRAATSASPAGLYPITLGTLAATANYALTYNGADLTVTTPTGSTAAGSAGSGGTSVAGFTSPGG